MKATGIVRRIDDLGRVVIPKEIRRTMRIREGDPLLMTLARKTLSGRCFALWTIEIDGPYLKSCHSAAGYGFIYF